MTLKHVSLNVKGDWVTIFFSLVIGVGLGLLGPGHVEAGEPKSWPSSL